MTQYLRSAFVVALAGIFMTGTGCAKKPSTKTRVNALEAQVNVLTEELTRLDQAVQENRTAAAQIAEAPSFGAASSGNTGVYRTPSGFELPSINIQKALKNAGYYQGALDGKVGPGTKDAVKSFQRDNGLGADGVVGRRTWEKLRAYLAS